MYVIRSGVYTFVQDKCVINKSVKVNPDEYTKIFNHYVNLQDSPDPQKRSDAFYSLVALSLDPQAQKIRLAVLFHLGSYFEAEPASKGNQRLSKSYYEQAFAFIFEKNFGNPNPLAIDLYNIAYMYETGKGVKQDIEIAMHYYGRALLAGDLQAEIKWNQLFYVQYNAVCQNEKYLRGKIAWDSIQC